MDIIEQLINLAMNDKLDLKTSTLNRLRISLDVSSKGFIRSTTGNNDTLEYCGSYFYTSEQVQVMRDTINGDHDEQGYMMICKLLADRFDQYLPTGFARYLKNRLLELRTVERLEPSEPITPMIHEADFNTLQSGVYMLSSQFKYTNGSYEFDQYLKGRKVAMQFYVTPHTHTVIFNDMSEPQNTATFKRHVFTQPDSITGMTTGDWKVIPRHVEYDERLEPAEPSEVIQLLTDIRDLLQVIRDERK